MPFQSASVLSFSSYALAVVASKRLMAAVFVFIINDILSISELVLKLN